jgi:hypothetical protein
MNTEFTTHAPLNLTVEVLEARTTDISNFLAEEAESADGGVVACCSCCCCGIGEEEQADIA